MYTNFMKAILYNPPVCGARIMGSEAYPLLAGSVLFYEANNGTIVVADLTGLSGQSKMGEPCKLPRFYGFHIHEGSRCMDMKNPNTAFESAGGHWNPTGCEHPNHAGDLPVLLSNNGVVFSACYTEAFIPWEVLGHTVIIHEHPDDYHTQPSGDSGNRIGCGMIVQYC